MSAPNTVPPGTPADASDLGRDAARTFYLLLSRWWLIALFVVIALALATAYLSVTPKIFSARSVIQVQQAEQKLVNIQDLNSQEYRSIEDLKTVEQSLSSRSLMLRVVKANQLGGDPLFAPRKKDNTEYTEDELVQLMSEKVSVKLRRNTRLIDIVVEDPQPERAQQLAKSFVDEFVAQSYDQQVKVSQDAGRFLAQEAENLKAKLEKSEAKAREYREVAQDSSFPGTVVSLEDKQNIVVEKLRGLNQKVTEAKAERLKLETDVAVIQSSKTRSVAQLLQLASVANLPEVMDIRKQLQQKETELGSVKERYLERHPKFIRAVSELKELKQTLERVVGEAADLVVKSYDGTKQTEAKLEAALVEQEDLALRLNKIAIPYNALVRELESDRALYEAVAKRMKETSVTQSFDRTSIRVVETPLIPTNSIKPRPVQVIFCALLGGVVFGVGLVLLLDRLDGSLRGVDETERTLKLPVVAAIPSSKSKTAEGGQILIKEPASREAEAFRSLRTAVSFLGNKENRRIVLFTSAVPGEGKSYCSLNYAVSLTQQRLRTLIIDADLRRPALTKILVKERNAPGLTLCLTGERKLSDTYRATEIDKLFVLGAGPQAPNPAELLADQDFPDLLKQALQIFDRVVIDSAPINAVSDTLLIAEHADSICLVVRAAKTSKHAILRACHLLTQAKASPSGIVLNRLHPGRGASYYYYFYGGDYVDGRKSKRKAPLEETKRE